jgi:hypothetical protein
MRPTSEQSHDQDQHHRKDKPERIMMKSSDERIMAEAEEPAKVVTALLPRAEPSSGRGISRA